MSAEIVTPLWGILYVNACRFMGRYLGRWTWGEYDDLEGAELYTTNMEANQALQALKAEARERIKADQDAEDMWWSICGGMIVVVELENILRPKPSPIEAADGA